MLMATRARSPPERASRFLMTLPGGLTRISMPLFSTSFSSSRAREASPPPNSSAKTRPKWPLMAAKFRRKMSRIWPFSSPIIRTSRSRLSSTSSTWALRLS